MSHVNGTLDFKGHLAIKQGTTWRKTLRWLTYRRPRRSSFNDAAMTSGSAVLTSATAEFNAEDVGRSVRVTRALAGNTLITTISSVQSATQATLAASATATVVNAGLTIYKPVNLTGYTARMKVRPDFAEDEVISLTTENGRIALGGTAGTIDLTITAADTALLDALEDGRYDLELISSGGIVDSIPHGQAGLICINAEVTE